MSKCNTSPWRTWRTRWSGLITGLGAALAFSTGAVAQNVSAYTFAESAGSYTALGGTNITATGDDGTAVGVPIGFTFQLGVNFYTDFGITTNGWMRLGAGAFPGSAWTNSTGNWNSATFRSIIAPMWDDNHRNAGAITYSTTGVAPNRVLTVDWNGVNIGGGGATSGTNLANYQVRLYETTNVIEIVYGTMATAGALSASIGLSDASGYQMVTPGAPGTSSSIAENHAVSSVANVANKMYTFTPPPPPDCPAVLGLAISSVTTTSVSGTWNVQANAGGYNWEVRTTGAGGSGATGLVQSNSVGTNSVTVSGLAANTSYVLWVQSDCTVNSDGLSTWNSVNAFTGYCTPTVTNTGDHTSAFSTSLGVTNINNPSGAASPGNYGDFTAMTVSSPENTTFNYSLSYVGGTNGIRVWVDWDNDLQFEAGELMSSVGPAGSPQTGSVTVPASTPLGNYRMRVRTSYNSLPAGPCGNTTYGETEDYTLAVVAPPACQFVAGTTVSNISFTGATVSWTCTGCTGSYIVEYGAPGFTPGTDGTAGVGGTIATSATTTVNLSGLTANTNYHVYVRQECTAGSSYSANSSSVTLFTGYCAVGGGATSEDYFISDFTTSGGSTNITNTSGGFSAGGYGDFTAQAVSQIASGAINFSISIDGGSTYGINIWVDWNQDLDFADSGENVYTSGGYVSAAPRTGSFTVPPGTAAGNYRMRVREDYLAVSPPACGTSGYAEAEDYTLTVTAPPACMFPTGLTAAATSSTSIAGSWTAEPTAVNGYNWELRTSGTPGNPGAVAGQHETGTTFSATGLTLGTTYYFYVQSDCDVDGFSTWAGPVTVVLSYCTPAITFMDPDGITNVTFANVNQDLNTEADGGWSDYSAVVGAIGGPGTVVPVSVAIPTGYTYDMRIWVDWNNDLDFGDAGEVVATGVADGTNPWVTSFTVPVSQAAGSFRMRIGGIDSGTITPCYAGSYGAFADFTVSVCVPPTDNGTVVVDDCTEQEFVVDVTVDLAGAASATVQYSVNGVAQTPVAYTAGMDLGPFAAHLVVDVTVVTNQGCSVDLGNFYSACNIELDCSALSLSYTYCYDANDTKAWTFSNPGGTVSVRLLSGELNDGQDYLFIWEGEEGTALHGSTPFVTGLIGTPQVITSVGSTLSLSFVDDGDGINCAQGGVSGPLTFEVRCGGCENPAGTVVNNIGAGPLVDCAAGVNGEFTAYIAVTGMGVDGTTSLPPTTLGYQITRNNGTPEAPVLGVITSVGYYPIGNFPLGTLLDVTLLAAQGSCNESISNDFTVGYNACPPANDQCTAAQALTLNPDGTCPANAVTGTTLGADQTGALPECQASGTAQDVWYTFNSGPSNSFTMTLTAGTAGNVGVQLFTACGTPVAGACLANVLPAQNPITITVASGTNYWLRVFTDVSAGAAGTFNICVSAFNPCTDIQNISACGVATQTTRTAGNGAWTGYGGPFAVPGKERLFTFTPTVTGNYTLQVTAVTGGYVDFSFKAATVGCNNTGWTYVDDFNAPGTSAGFALTAGTQYYIMWDGESNTNAYDVTFQLNCPLPPPANDNCGGATTVAVNTGTTCTVQTAGTIGGATDSGVAASCGTSDDDVWYSFVASATTHTITLNNVSGGTDMAFAVYANGCGTLTPVTCSDPNTTTLNSLSVGQTYLVQVYSYGTAGALNTTFDLCVNTPPVPGAECSGAINIASIPVTNQNLVCNTAVLPGLLNATNVPTTCGGATTTYMSGQEALYTFTPTVSDDYLIGINGVTYTSIFVYANACPTNGGTCVGSVGNSAASKNLSVALTAGVQYFIWFDTWAAPNSPCPGTFSLSLAPDAPANDNCAGAVSLTVNPNYACGSVTPGTTAFATASGNAMGSCTGTPDDDVWYSFVPTATAHRVSLSNTGGSTDMYMKFYRGTDCGTMVDHACSDPETANLTGLTIGQRVFVRVYTYAGGASSSFNICVGTAPPPPANDNCAGAVALTVNTGMSCTSQTAGTVQSATNSGIAVTPCVGTADDDVWYSFTATQATHIVSLNGVAGSVTSMNFQVFSGVCGTQTSVACGATGSAPTTVVNSLTAGQVYYVRVYTNTATGGQNTTFNICVTTPPVGPPANDNCAGAIGLTVNAGQTCTSQTFGTVFGATGTADATCAGAEDDDVWYSFVATGPTHTVSLNSVAGSVTSMNFQVLGGACGTLTNVVCSSTGIAPTAVASGLTAGNTYYVRVYTNTATGGQTTTFNVCVTTPPANDLCANAITVGCNSITAGSTVGATNIGNPGTCTTDVSSAPGVWYKVQGWGGSMVASLCGATWDTKMGVFTGSCGTLTCVAGNDDFCSVQSQVSWIGAVGVTYYIYVTGYQTNTGTFNLSVTCGSTSPSCAANGLNLEFQNDANPGQVTWEVYSSNGNQLVLSGADPIPGGGIGTQAICLPDGCYRLRVLDSAGDGMTTGGYELRTTGNERIIDNTNNFSTGSVSAISGNQTFCLPLGTDKLIWSSCDKLEWVNNKFIVATANPAVSAQYGVSNTTSGYEFWFFDPNGSYSFRRFRSHATSDGYGTGAVRACHFKVNGWVHSGATPHLPANILLNVRVRGRVAGSNLAFGPACQFKIDAALAACPRVKLQDDPANTSDYSCGVSRNFGGSGNANNRIYANPPQPVPVVASSNIRYQFRFRIPGESICIVRPPQTSAQMTLNWTTGTPLQCSKTYEVDVRVSVDGGATWCFGPAGTDQASACAATQPWGKVCNVTINPCGGGGGVQGLTTESTSTFTMYPNPNRGDQLFVSLSSVEKGVNTVSVDIFDLTGKRVMARTIPVQDGFVNTNVELGSQLAGGLYMVNITAGDKAYTERLVIQP